jgi:hypothetical protein
VDGAGGSSAFCSQPGRLAQLGERLPYKQEVTGSIPVPPITPQTAYCASGPRGEATLETILETTGALSS